MIGKITTYDGEKSVWSAELVSEKSNDNIKKTKSDKVERKSEGDVGAGLTDDLSDFNPRWYLFNYERASIWNL